MPDKTVTIQNTGTYSVAVYLNSARQPTATLSSNQEFTYYPGTDNSITLTVSGTAVTAQVYGTSYSGSTPTTSVTVDVDLVNASEVKVAVSTEGNSILAVRCGDGL